MIGRRRRHGAVRVAVAVGALALVSACGSSGGDDSGDGWTYTDDVGTEIGLEEVPDRIVAQSSVAAALTDLGLGERIVGVFGPVEGPDGGLDPQAEGLDVDAVEDVTGGGDYGDIDLERLAALEPDLILTSTYVEPTLWYINEDARARLEGAYPIGVVSFDGESQTDIFANTERLAEALGADPADFVAGREAFEAAGDRLRSVVEELEDPTFEAVSPTAETLYVSSPDANPDLKYYRDELGLDIVTPDEVDLDSEGYWRVLSWEQADAYEADIALWDARGGQASLDLLKDQPVWNRTTAAQEDRYVALFTVAPPSAEGRARVMERFADDLERLQG